MTFFFIPIRILTHLFKPKANGCNGLSISFKMSMVDGVTHRLSVATTMNKIAKKIANLKLKFFEHFPSLAIIV
jgi:hypothetical protein